MMRQFRIIYALAATAILSLTACSSDVTEEQGGGADGKGQPIRVRLSVSPANPAGTRAWTDNENATTAEMMNVWTVVAVNNADNKVASIYACKPSGEPDQEIDDYVELPAAGTYRFYSFANMSPKVVMSLLGISGYDTPTEKSSTRDAVGGESFQTPDDSNNNPATGRVTSYSDATAADPFTADGSNFAVNKYYSIPFSENATLSADVVAAKTVNVAGNNFNLLTDNGYGAKGIPMSNVQTIEVSAGSSLDLIVIRMVAKIQLQIYNDKGSDVTIESFTLTDVTRNEDNNLKLLPNLTSGANTMNYIHGDLQPNLNSTTPPNRGDLTLLTASDNNVVSKEDHSLSSGTPRTYTFYVNESVAPNNGFGRFFLKIKLQGETEQRYALIDDANATGKTGSWNYIARNDFRVIPIVLDDYKLDIIPYDFPAIGVYPASVKEEDGLYTINFHDYGHFHLVPSVTKVSDSSVVPFTATVPSGTYASTSWGLVTDFATSWGSWTDATKASTATDDGSFYVSGSTATADASDNGGWPTWDTTTKWNGCNTSPSNTPFIFGKIADPGAPLSADKKIYHEFSIYLYKQGSSAPRMMTYRLYMILDKDQMSYARGLRHSDVERRAHD